MSKNSVVLIDDLKDDLNFTVNDNEDKTFVLFLAKEKNQTGNLSVVIKGSNANVRILGIIIEGGRQQINLHSLQDHRMKASVSDLFIKSVLFGSSKFFYEGLIKIAPLAQKSNAYQKNQNLLIGQNTWADSRPKLEILANDVRCTHGATIGKIDKEVLYYLKTRGLSQESSEKLVIEGFFKDILDRIPDEKLVGDLQKEIDLKVSNLLN